jgi:hypothetical protein
MYGEEKQRLPLEEEMEAELTQEENPSLRQVITYVDQQSRRFYTELEDRDRVLHEELRATRDAAKAAELRSYRAMEQNSRSKLPDVLNPSMYPVRYAAAAGVILAALWRYFFGAEISVELKDAILLLVPVVFAVLGGKATTANADLNKKGEDALNE